jgi:hypothetical protein
VLCLPKAVIPPDLALCLLTPRVKVWAGLDDYELSGRMGRRDRAPLLTSEHPVAARLLIVRRRGPGLRRRVADSQSTRAAGALGRITAAAPAIEQPRRTVRRAPGRVAGVVGKPAAFGTGGEKKAQR